MSDAQAEFQILDRRSFGRFLGLDDGDNTPDETTIWRFREALVRANAIEALFARFDSHLKSLGYLAMGGQIVDASIISAPRQRMTDEERAVVRQGGIPQAWAAKPARLAQKDRDARWTLKRGRRKKGPDGKFMAEIATPLFGYKSHLGIDQRHGFIRTWSASHAARSGRIRPIAARRTNAPSCVPASSRRSISAERPASRSPTNASAPMLPGPRSAPPSNMSLLPRNTGWACSSAPSAWRGQRRRSASPISRSTSNASSTGNVNRTRHDGRHHRADADTGSFRSVENTP
ncbi:transposase [Novosphingobium panipatense]|uniref:transposase n=1 Tax=Novosphingobium panipatense TaxID=428991 RepID=UPI003606DC36